MNLVKLILKINQRKYERGWRKATSTYTGKSRKVMVHTKNGYREVAEGYMEYQIKFMTEQMKDPNSVCLLILKHVSLQKNQ